MIYLSALQSPASSPSTSPNPNSTSTQVIASQSLSAIRPKMPDQSINIMDSQHDDDDGSLIPPLAQSQSQNHRRGRSPSLSPLQSQSQNQNIQSILHKVSNTLLSLDSDNRTHRRQMDKASENMSNYISERLDGIEEIMDRSMREGEKWKDEILHKIDHVDAKNKERIEAMEKNFMEIANRISILEKGDVGVGGKVDEVTKKIDDNNTVLMDSFKKNMEEVHMIDTEKIQQLEEKIQGLQGILEQVLLSQFEFGKLQRAQHQGPSTTTSQIMSTPPPTSISIPANLSESRQTEPAPMPMPMIGGQDQSPQVEDDEMADMTLDMELDTAMDHFGYTDPVDRLAPFQYGIDPKDVMLPPPQESDAERSSTSTSARAAACVEVGESSSSSRPWWNSGGGKRKQRDESQDAQQGRVVDEAQDSQHDVIDLNRDEEQRNESASEERLDTPQTQSEDHFQTASPSIVVIPDLAGEDELVPDDDNDADSQSSRPPARLPFPPRSNQKSSSPIAITKRKAGPGRPRKSAPALLNSHSSSSTSTEPVNDPSETVSTPPNSQRASNNRSRAKTETPSRASKRSKIRPSYFEEVQEIPRSTAPKSKSGKGRQRNFYGKTMLSTKGLLTGDGIKKTEAKWPIKGPYTIKSKLEEIVCDACRGRSHWACAGLDFDVDMSDKTWLCPDCEHIIEVEGKPRASIDTVQQVRCIRYNCVLRDKKAIEVREGEEDIFVIERLVGQRAIARMPDSQARIFEYLVKWEGWGWQDCTWEPVSNLAPRHENLISTFREVAQKSEVNLKAKVGLLHEARGCWDPITGNSLIPDTPEESVHSERGRSASASASVSRAGTSLSKVNKRRDGIRDREGTVGSTTPGSYSQSQWGKVGKGKMIQQGEVETNENENENQNQEKGKEIGSGDVESSGQGGKTALGE